MSVNLTDPKVVRAIFYETGTYGDQPSRGFMSRGHNDDIVDILMDRTERGQRINEISVGSVVDEIIGIDYNSRDIIQIANGWGEKRLGFIIAILEEEYRGHRALQILTGYTSHDDRSFRDELDPEMMLYVNNAMAFSETEINTATGPRIRYNRKGNDFILRGQRPSPRQSAFRDREHGDELIRPADIFYRESSSSVITRLGGADNTVLGRSNLSGEIKMGARKHNHVSSYLTDIINTGVLARSVVNEGNRGDDFDEDEVSRRLRKAKNETLNPAEYAGNILDSPYFDSSSKVFRRFIEQCAFEKEGSISLRDFRNAVDWESDCTELYTTGEASRASGRDSRRVSNRGDSESWERTDDEGMIATMVSRSLPALMMNSLISACMVMITNDTEDGEIDVVVSGEYPVIKGLDVSRNADILEDNIRTDLAQLITRRNELLVTVTVDLSIATDQIIRVSVNDGPEEEFISPLFCDGLISPQKSTQPGRLGEITDDIMDIIDELSDTGDHSRRD